MLCFLHLDLRIEFFARAHKVLIIPTVSDHYVEFHGIMRRIGGLSVRRPRESVVEQIHN